MEKPKRARRRKLDIAKVNQMMASGSPWRKLDIAKVNLKPSFADSGGQGVHREVESEGHAEKDRAVIEGATP